MALRRHQQLGRRGRLARRTALAPGSELVPRTVVRFPRVAASGEQRAKVAGLSCIVCGRAPCDPAHLVPQRLGGCPLADCVVPLCRTHHRLYDHAELSLGVHLGGRWRHELEHALIHVEPDELQAALAGRGWDLCADALAEAA